MANNEEQIKRAIVDGYRRGVCTADGCHIPEDKRGMAGKGSHFQPPKTPQYYENYDRIFTKKGKKHGKPV